VHRGHNGRGSRRDDDIDLAPGKLGRDLRKALLASLGPAVLDRDTATVDPTKFAQPLHKLATHSLAAGRVFGPRNPTVGTFAGCCARAASGHAAAAPPSNEINSRRFIRSPRRRGRVGVTVLPDLKSLRS